MATPDRIAAGRKRGEMIKRHGSYSAAQIELWMNTPPAQRRALEAETGTNIRLVDQAVLERRYTAVRRGPVGRAWDKLKGKAKRRAKLLADVRVIGPRMNPARLARALPKHRRISEEEALTLLARLAGYDLARQPWQRHNAKAALALLQNAGFVQRHATGKDPDVERIEPAPTRVETPLQRAIRLGGTRRVIMKSAETLTYADLVKRTRPVDPRPLTYE